MVKHNYNRLALIFRFLFIVIGVKTNLAVFGATHKLCKEINHTLIENMMKQIELTRSLNQDHLDSIELLQKNQTPTENQLTEIFTPYLEHNKNKNEIEKLQETLNQKIKQLEETHRKALKKKKATKESKARGKKSSKPLQEKTKREPKCILIGKAVLEITLTFKEHWEKTFKAMGKLYGYYQEKNLWDKISPNNPSIKTPTPSSKIEILKSLKKLPLKRTLIEKRLFDQSISPRESSSRSKNSKKAESLSQTEIDKLEALTSKLYAAYSKRTKKPDLDNILEQGEKTQQELMLYGKHNKEEYLTRLKNCIISAEMTILHSHNKMNSKSNANISFKPPDDIIATAASYDPHQRKKSTDLNEVFKGLVPQGALEQGEASLNNVDDNDDFLMFRIVKAVKEIFPTYCQLNSDDEQDSENSNADLSTKIGDIQRKLSSYDENLDYQHKMF